MKSNLPWLADFRDPMTDESDPNDNETRDMYLAIEKQAIQNCQHTVFVTPDTKKMYENRFPEIDASKYSIIPNGFDEKVFIKAEREIARQEATNNKLPLKLIHSGLLYRTERNPEPFFKAISELKKEGFISKDKLQIILRATGDDEHYTERLNTLKIDDIIKLQDSAPYEAAIKEMLTAGGLLIFQASNCNHQIPAKLYEYLRAKRPILAITDRAGNTADVLRMSGIDCIVDLESSTDIKQGFRSFFEMLENKTVPIADDSIIQTHSRSHHSETLAGIFDQMLIK